MAKKHTASVPYVQPYRYPSPNIPLSAIRRFARKGVKPDAVISSPLLRARETAEGIASALGVDAEQDERLAPGATPEDVRAVVAGRGNTVVVVGHQPDCGQIVAAISGGAAPEFPAGGVRELEL